MTPEDLNNLAQICRRMDSGRSDVTCGGDRNLASFMIK